MQKLRAAILKAILVTLVGVLLSGSMLVNAATAGDVPPLKVSLALPGAVNFGEIFNITITVTNKISTTVNISKVAVGYALQNLRFRGPYEVNFNGVSVPAFQTKTFIVPFKITDGSGTVVGMTVILSNGSYTQDGVVGSTFGGVRVN